MTDLGRVTEGQIFCRSGPKLADYTGHTGIPVPRTDERRPPRDVQADLPILTAQPPPD